MEVDFDDKDPLKLIKECETEVMQNSENMQDSQDFEEQKLINLSEVPEEERIKLNDSLFHFSSTIKNDKLSLKLVEISAYAPFIYSINLSLEEFTKISKIFRSCENLEEVKTHIDRLFALKRITLGQEEGKEDSITFFIKAYDISEEIEIEIKGKRIITNEKDKALMKLYEIEKNQIKLMKEIEKYISQQKDNEIINKIKVLLNS